MTPNMGAPFNPSTCRWPIGLERFISVSNRYALAAIVRFNPNHWFLPMVGGSISGTSTLASINNNFSKGLCYLHMLLQVAVLIPAG